jgi:HEAT repeat protein
MKQRHPQQARSSDADALLATVEGRLAQRGDRAAAEEVARRAAGADAAGSARGVGTSVSRASQASGAGSAQCPTASDEDDVRLAAMNALLNMDAANAMPILKDVLARRDECSVPLRRKAIFLVSQKRSAEAEDVLLSAARSDPDPEVREQAVFWLSNVNTEKAVSAIDEILRTSTDPKIQEKAIFALSQHRSERAGEILRNFAQRADAPKALRGNALFWLGQARGAENGAFLRQVYPTLQDADLKERVLQAVSQRNDAENADWLLQIALRDSESMEVRKQALFWAGQGKALDVAKLAELYDRLPAGEMKKQLLFVLSQRRDGPAVDKLMDIARNDPDLGARKQAIFWLGQSRDPRVAQFLSDLIKR